MKVCVNNKQDSVFLELANEILVQYDDRNDIKELGNKYSAAIVLDIPYLYSNEIDFVEISRLRDLSPNGFMLKLHTTSLIDMVKSYNLDYFLDYNIRTLYELRAVVALGVKYIQVDAPLFFEQDIVKSFGVPVRINPSIFNISPLANIDFATGTWVRPEDIELYDPCTIEFGIIRAAKEQALIRIYVQEKCWPGKLDLVIADATTDALNRLIFQDFTEHRLNCGQKCMKPMNNCRICHKMLDIASQTNVLKSFQENKEEVQ